MSEQIIGIDPGFSGAFVCLDGSTGSILWTLKMPLQETSTAGRFYDLPTISEMMGLHADRSLFVLEKVGVVPGAARSSVWSFAEGYGSLKGLLAAHGCRYLNPPPKVWQSWAFVGQPSHLPPKDKALLAFQQRFPKVLPELPKIGKRPHDGIIDAALIAGYGKMHDTL